MTNPSPLSQYQQSCPQTAIYPHYMQPVDWPHRQNPFYCALELVGEAGEFDGALTFGTPACQKKELGDVCYPAAMLCNECGWEMDDLLTHGYDILADNSSLSCTLLEVAYGVVEPIKKLWRDGYSEKQWTLLRDALAATIAAIDEHAERLLGSGIAEIAAKNMEKLQARKAKGTLHGSGGDR